MPAPTFRMEFLCASRRSHKRASIRRAIGIAKMLDIVFVAITLVLFALMAGYVRACDRL
jgi:hypothetical protein